MVAPATFHNAGRDRFSPQRVSIDNARASDWRPSLVSTAPAKHRLDTAQSADGSWRRRQRPDMDVPGRGRWATVSPDCGLWNPGRRRHGFNKRFRARSLAVALLYDVGTKPRGHADE